MEGKHQNNQKLVDAKIKQFGDIIKGKPPSSWYTGELQAFPLAAQFFRELHSRGYTQLQIKAYKCPVAEAISGGESFVPILKTPDRRRVECHSAPEWHLLLTAKLFRQLGWSLETDKQSALSCW
jgi:hypothetical protein